ncbi:MAG: CBS domain-containing protein [Thaumarchaeota archaeon]|nr:CBS domain-containing protein [Nitrososphaerota archaeon]
MSLGRSFSEIKVKDVMSRNLIVADPATTVFQIAKMMEQGIGAVLVKKDTKPEGIITDRDFAIKVAVNNMPMDTTVDKVASYPLQTIGMDESIADAAAIMATKKIRKIAVVDGDSVMGIITSTDLVNKMAS